MISEAETSKRILFTFPSEIIFWQLTGSGGDVEDFLGRKLSELESGILCGQCWDILLGLHEIGLTYQEHFIRLENGRIFIIGLGIPQW